MIQFSRGLSKTETKSNLSSPETDFHKFFSPKAHHWKKSRHVCQLLLKWFLRQEPLEMETKPEVGTLWGSEKQRMWLKELLKKLSCKYHRLAKTSCLSVPALWNPYYLLNFQRLHVFEILGSPSIISSDYWLSTALSQMRVMDPDSCYLLSLQSSYETCGNLQSHSGEVTGIKHRKEKTTETKGAQMTPQHLSEIVTIPRSLEFLALESVWGTVVPNVSYMTKAMLNNEDSSCTSRVFRTNMILLSFYLGHQPHF